MTFECGHISGSIPLIKTACWDHTPSVPYTVPKSRLFPDGLCPGIDDQAVSAITGQSPGQFPHNRRFIASIDHRRYFRRMDIAVDTLYHFQSKPTFQFPVHTAVYKISPAHVLSFFPYPLYPKKGTPFPSAVTVPSPPDCSSPSLHSVY